MREGKGRGEEEGNSKAKTLPANPPAIGKRKEKGRKRKEPGGGGGEEITKEQGKENISESSNQENNRDGFCFSQQPNALRIGQKQVKLPNPSHAYDAQTPGRGGG